MKNQKANNKEKASEAAILFTDIGWDNYLYWKKEDAKPRATIHDLIDACMKDPFKGIDKPEPLKGNLTGLWSRRIDLEHRLVYAVEADVIYIVACRFHY